MRNLFLFLLVWIMLVFFVVVKPKSHEDPNGWHYDIDCCDNEDCQPISDKSIKATPEGWHIILKPGEHRFSPNGMDRIVSYTDVRLRDSKDEDFHLCLSPKTENHIFCFYVPVMGY